MTHPNSSWLHRVAFREVSRDHLCCEWGLTWTIVVVPNIGIEEVALGRQYQYSYTTWPTGLVQLFLPGDESTYHPLSLFSHDWLHLADIFLVN